MFNIACPTVIPLDGIHISSIVVLPGLVLEHVLYEVSSYYADHT